MECTKITYDSEEEARDDLISITERQFKPWKDRHLPIRFYKCQHCPGYHLTSKPTVTVYK